MGLSYPYYPGCSQTGTAVEYDMSVRAVFRRLGVGLTELDDWSCCGSTPAHTVDHSLSCALSARNLQLVSKSGGNRVTTPCPSCLAALKTAEHKMEDEAFRGKVNALLDEPYEGGVESISILQALVEDIGLEEVAGRTVKKLGGLVAAPYYGCIMNRPPGLMKFDDPENPMAMDRLIEAIGGKVVDFPHKVECCGAAYGIPRKDIVMKLSNRILDMAVRCGANAIVVACPLCHQNLDLRQGQINFANRTGYRLPVLYITQAIGLALGIEPAELGLDKHAVNPGKLIAGIDNAAGEGDK